MKRFFTALLFSFACTLGILAQAPADRILGTYLTEAGNAKVSIARTGNKYVGTIIWTKTAGKLDSKNPNEAERSKKIVGKQILKDFVYTDDNTWSKGTIYDPESGKTYSCKITRESDGTLKVRGYIGISLLGRTTEWKRL